MNNYKEALEVLKNRTSKKLDNNTYLEKRENGNLAVKLHQTDVVTYTPKNEVILSSGGWKTPTTKDRINKFSRAGITQKNNQWFVYVKADYSNPDKPVYFENPTMIFKDGVIITPKNKIKGGEIATKTKEKTFNKEKKAIKTYCEAFVTALFDGKVEKPGAGDCWYCSMKTDDGQSLGDKAGNNDHIKQHIEEGYFVPSLLFNALENIPTSRMTKGVIGSIWRKEEINGLDSAWVKKEATQNLYRYIMRKMGNPNSVINFK
jgi:hypothetical protein